MYTHTDLLTARTSLLARLQPESPAYVYWSSPELDSSVQEALRIYQALTGIYRIRSTPFSTTANRTNYDLTAILPASEFGYSITDRQLIQDIQRHLLEPANPTAWSGSEQFTYQQIVDALQRRRNQFLLDTGIVINWSILNVPINLSGRIPLPSTCIDVRRADWVDSTSGLIYPLYRDDEFATNAFIPQWNLTPSNPFAYSVAVTPRQQIQLFPPPSSSGTVNLFSTDIETPLNPSVSSSLLRVPDNWSWVVKWGAICDLLSADGQARDPFRASYCKSLYDLGVSAARVNPSILDVQLAGVSIGPPGSSFDLDTFYPEWQNTARQPDIACMAGRNLLTLPCPNAAYSITTDLIANMPVPLIDADQLQVGAEELDPILGLAQHLASFKMSGQEFTNTTPLFQSFLSFCALQNSRLSALSTFRMALEQPALRQPAQVERTLHSIGSSQLASA